MDCIEEVLINEEREKKRKNDNNQMKWELSFFFLKEEKIKTRTVDDLVRLT